MKVAIVDNYYINREAVKFFLKEQKDLQFFEVNKDGLLSLMTEEPLDLILVNNNVEQVEDFVYVLKKSRFLQDTAKLIVFVNSEEEEIDYRILGVESITKPYSKVEFLLKIKS